MKLKPTPFLIISVCLIIYSIYLIIYYLSLSSAGNLWPLLVLIYIVPGGFCLLLYFVLRKVFKSRIWRQIGVEILIIVIILLYIFSKTSIGKGKIVLDLPHGYHGSVFLIYGVEDKPKLPSRSFLRTIHLKIPNSGIFLTSDDRQNDFTNPFVIYDSTQTRYNFGFSWDTFHCGNKTYLSDNFFLGNYVPDSLNFKKKTICDSIK
jgi:hypothetical protein